MRRAFFLASAALLMLLTLAPMAMAEGVPAPELADVQEGDSCNAETGEPGPGEGVFERDIDGGLSCVSQEGEGPGVTPPTRVDTGGGGMARQQVWNLYAAASAALAGVAVLMVAARRRPFKRRSE